MTTALATQILGPNGQPWVPAERRTSLRDPAEWLLEWALGDRTTSGERVNEEIAMGLSAWFAAIRAISEDVAKLDLILYSRRADGGKERATGHPLYKLLHDSPNPDMTAITFEETLLQHALGWGNGYAEIVRNGSGMAVELWPLDPTTVMPKRDGGTLVYQIMLQNGGFVNVPPSEILHVHGLGPMGDSGYNITRVAREAIGTYIALQKFAGAFFAGGAAVGAVMEHPGNLSDKALNHLRTTWNERHGGGGNAHKVAILEEGMKYQQLGIAPEQGQFNESRMFAVEDVARWFRIPPHKLQHLARATWGNIEHLSIEYLQDTLLPWMKRIEQEINRKLIRQTGKFFFEHLAESALRADIAARTASYKAAIEGGWMSRNEVRIRENMNPEPGLDFEDEPEPAPMPPQLDDGAEPPAEEDEDRSLCLRLASVHRQALALRFRSVLKNENTMMKRSDRVDWLGSHEPAIRMSLIPAVDTFCSSVWCVINGGEMPDSALRAVADATAVMSERHMERVSGRSAGWEPWPISDADAWAAAEMAELAATMAVICKEHRNGKA